MKKVIFYGILTLLLTSCKIDPSPSPEWVVSTFAGSGEPGHADNNDPLQAQFKSPTGVALDSSGNFYVADRDNHRIRKITSAGVVSTFAGSSKGSADNNDPLQAQFNEPTGVAVDSSGNVYVADSRNHRIRKITSAGIVSTIAGSSKGFAENSNSLQVQFNFPTGVAVDSSGNVYVLDRDNHRIRKITRSVDSRAETWAVSPFAGSGKSGHRNGVGAQAQFSFPYGVFVDASDNIYVLDRGHQHVRMITPERVVSTLADFGWSVIGNPIPALMQFNEPTSVALDSSANFYVADRDNHRIRKIEYKAP